MSKFDFTHVMVMGAGGVGGYFGGKLVQNSGKKISMVARGTHLEKIKKEGLIIESVDGNFIVRGPASDNPEDLPEPDLIIFSVKSFDTDNAIKQIRLKVGKNTQILPLQNSIENLPKLEFAFGEHRVMRSLCRIGIRISEPGKLSHTHPGRIVIGERDGKHSARIVKIKHAFEESGVKCRISKDFDREFWLKFSWNAIFNMITAAENKTTDYFYKNGKPQKRLWKLADEILKVANVEDVNLEKKDLYTIVEKTREIGTFVTSTLHDRRMGKKLEFDAFTGALLRLGEKHGLDLPEYAFLHQQLKEIDAHSSPH